MFEKGYVPWNKKFYPDKLKILCHCGCGKYTSGKIDHGKIPEYIVGHFAKGKKIPYKSRPKMKGRIVWNKGRKGRQKNHNIDGLSLGRYVGKIGLKGDKNPRWRGGITPFRIRFWQSFEYKNWRKSVFERDKYTCGRCNKRGGYLEAHHIKAFWLYPDLRLKVDNGMTLCKTCHRKEYRSKKADLFLKRFYEDQNSILFPFLNR